MANRTDPAAKTIRGTDPQNLVEKILRFKIWQSTYWKNQCFGLTAETLVDKAMELNHLGCTFGGNRKPTPFMCLVMKMLQLQPEKEIVLEFIKNNDYKYVRVLGAFYLRLTGTDVDVYRYLEPLYNDYRKLKHKLSDGRFSLTRVDEIIDELLTKDYACDVALPQIKKRWTLESIGSLEPRKSALEDDFEEEEDKEEEEDEVGAGTHRRRDGHKYRDGDYDREYGRGRDRDRDMDRHRDRDRERGRGRYCLRDHEKDNYYGCEGEREMKRGIAGIQRDSRRDREWGRRRRRSPSRRSRSRSRDSKDDRRKRHTRGRADEEEPKRKKEKKTDHHPDQEIAEANRMRASLGLKPLKI